MKIIHLHQPKTGGKSLQSAFKNSLSDKELIMYRQSEPEKASGRVRRGDFKVISGHIHNAPRDLKEALLDIPSWFTVVRDPADRIVSYRNYVLKTKGLDWHDRLRDLSLRDGVRALIEANTSYARSGQCEAITWKQADATLEGALEVLQARFVLCGTLEQLPYLFSVLQDWGFISKSISLPHKNKTAPLSTEDRQFVCSLTEENCYEDFRLHSWLTKNGPLVVARPGHDHNIRSPISGSKEC